MINQALLEFEERNARDWKIALHPLAATKPAPAPAKVRAGPPASAEDTRDTSEPNDGAGACTGLGRNCGRLGWAQKHPRPFHVPVHARAHARDRDRRRGDRDRDHP